jgi:superfamily II DNA or RNA helicase
MKITDVFLFDEGTLLLKAAKDLPHLPPQFVWDDRVEAWRALAYHYRPIVEYLKQQKIAVENTVPRYNHLKLALQYGQIPHLHQREALEAWKASGQQGVVVLPTGSGKSYLALLAILEINRSTLVVAPTIDLMNQWYDLLTQSFHVAVGILGGGYHELQDLTVTTYDSACMHMERYGNRFAMLVFDEVHHLPGETYRYAAEFAIAPYRLGLTATPERADGRHLLLDTFVGPIVYEKGIREMAGTHLAEYSVQRMEVEMVAEEVAEYQAARTALTQFLEAKNLKLGSLEGWRNFVRLSSRSSEGRQAMLAYQRSRKIALGTSAKLELLESLLKRHAHDRVLIFTNDNETVYSIAQEFLIPAITHQTKTRERKEILEGFNTGKYLALVTSKVLNEGVNIPDANVAIVLSGSGSIREHVQRLGRILRRRKGKQAMLYEIIAKDTIEHHISARRRRHDAYRGSAPDTL